MPDVTGRGTRPSDSAVPATVHHANCRATVRLPRHPARGRAWLVGQPAWRHRDLPGAPDGLPPRSSTTSRVQPGIPPGVAHLVAWPDTLTGAEYRRHWHTACWQRRR